MKTLASLLAASAVLTASPVLAEPVKLAARQSSTGSANTPVVSVRGNAFFAGNERFYIRGVDYQPGGSANLEDPIADIEVCRRDIEKFRELGINTIRVYTVDNSRNHDECMALLADSGIYLALDVNTPDYSINRADPAPSYNDVYLQNVFATVDTFANYDNTLLFFSANEVINDNQTSSCAPYVKATTRDIRQYIRARGYRPIPVGYSAADIDSNRFETASYMNCGSDEERSDFFAFNDYSWCDPSNFMQSGWDQKVQRFSEYSIPLFLSEFGCNTNEREFNEIASLYSSDMAGVYSGGLVYEYSQEPSDYGLVEINGDAITELPDFTTLRDALANTPPPRGDGGSREDGEPSECPVRSESWEVDGNELPEIPEPARRFFEEGAGPGVGFQGDGSQYTGTPSSSMSNGSTTSSSSGSASSSGAAASLRGAEMGLMPVVCGVVVVLSSTLGAALL